MQGIILAGGFGSRLKSVVKDVPKPMAPIGGQPFLAYLLDYLNNYGFTKIVLAVGYKQEIIKNYFFNRYKGIELVYSVEESPLGTGGSIKKALEYIDDDYAYILNGDTFFEVDFHEIKTTQSALLCCKYLTDFSRYGQVVIKDKRIVSFEEKKEHQSGFINGGIYLLKRNVFENLNLPSSFSLENDFFSRYVDKIYFDSFISDGYFIDIGIPSDYEKAQDFFYE